MGFFDVQILKECKSQKEVIALKEKLETELLNQSLEKEEIDSNEVIKNYKAPKGILKYNIAPTEHNNTLVIYAELQQVLMLTILILFSILFTYGIGVVLIVGFAFYQRIHTTKALNTLIDSL